MKKIISLIASVAMLATVFTSVSAAEIANNAPVTETTVTEITAEEFENDWVGEALPDGQKAYLVEATATGLDLSSVRSGSTAAAKKKRTGVLLMMAEYELKFDSVENVAAVYGVDGIATFTSEEKKAYALALFNDAPTAYPTTTDTATAAVTATDAYVTAFVVTTTGPVTGNVVASYKISSFEANAGTGTQDYTNAIGNVGYTVNGEEGTAVALGEEGGDDPIVPDPEPKEMEITVDPDRFDLDVDGDKEADGYAWEVLVTNYDSTKTVSAKFTDAETGATRGAKEKTEITGLAPIAEANGGSVSFVALLQLSQFRSVNLEIVVE